MSGERVLVMVDGVRLNTVRGHGAQASLVAVDKLDAVEVLPGAGSAQYGSDALGGVVNFVTHRPLITTAPRQTIAYSVRGSDPGAQISQTATWRFTGSHLGVEFSGSTGRQDFLHTPDGRVLNSGSHDQSVSGRATLRLGTSTLDYEHAAQRGYDIGLPAFGNAAGSHGNYLLQSRDLDRIEWVTPGWARFAPETRVLVVGQDFVTDFNETAADTVLAGRYRYLKYSDARDHVTTSSWGVQPAFRFEGLANLRLSGEWRRETAEGPRVTRSWMTTLTGAPPGTATTGTTETVPPASRTVWSTAAFVSPHVGRLRVEAGARYDEQKSHADSRYAPLDPTKLEPAYDLRDLRTSVEGGVSYDFGHIEPYLHGSTGYRAPNLDERFYDGY